MRDECVFAVKLVDPPHYLLPSITHLNVNVWSNSDRFFNRTFSLSYFVTYYDFLEICPPYIAEFCGVFISENPSLIVCCVLPNSRFVDETIGRVLVKVWCDSYLFARIHSLPWISILSTRSLKTKCYRYNYSNILLRFTSVRKWCLCTCIDIRVSFQEMLSTQARYALCWWVEVNMTNRHYRFVSGAPVIIVSHHGTSTSLHRYWPKLQ